MSCLHFKKINLAWLAVFLVMLALSVGGCFMDYDKALFDMPNNHLFANVAWMITATIFVLMMTPGLSFFMAEWCV